MGRKSSGLTSKERIRLYRAKAHHVVAIIDIETDEVITYKISIAGENGEIQTPHDPETQYVREVGLAPTFRVAEKIKAQVADWSISDLRKQAPKLPVFDDTMPEDPRSRAAAFRSMAADEQEDVIYRALLTSGQSIHKVTKWLTVKPSEVKEAIDDEIVEAAKAELELRIGKAMLGCIDDPNRSVAQAAKMFLSKAVLGWNEQGPKDAGEGSDADITVTVVTNDNPEVAELRAELDQKVAAAETSGSKRAT